jgi:protein-S-isoprenylcysteine O-methyltransferase Ste14
MEEAMSADTPATGPKEGPGTRVLVRRRAIQLGLFVAVQAAVLLFGSGHLGWARAWVYIASYVGLIALTRFVVRDPELFAERAQVKKDAKAWDKLISVVFGVFGVGLLVVAALDVRFAWSPPMSTAVAAAGLAAFVAGFGLSTWAMASNRFFSGLVRIQADRGHTVATGGPYRFVRHPGYVGFIVGSFATALLLGSRWALVPAALSGVLTVVRTALEDRTLHDELPGYRDYAARVRYRLLPPIW